MTFNPAAFAARRARLLEQMENSGVVSAMQSNGNREIIAPTASAE